MNKRYPLTESFEPLSITGQICFSLLELGVVEEAGEEVQAQRPAHLEGVLAGEVGEEGIGAGGGAVVTGVGRELGQVVGPPQGHPQVGGDLLRSWRKAVKIERGAADQSALVRHWIRLQPLIRQFGEDGTVIRGKVNKADVGVMQINEKYHAETALKLGYDIYSVEGNVAFGKYLYKKYGTSPWYSSSACWLQASTIAEK